MFVVRLLFSDGRRSTVDRPVDRPVDRRPSTVDRRRSTDGAPAHRRPTIDARLSLTSHYCSSVRTSDGIFRSVLHGIKYRIKYIIRSQNTENTKNTGACIINKFIYLGQCFHAIPLVGNQSKWSKNLISFGSNFSGATKQQIQNSFRPWT